MSDPEPIPGVTVTPNDGSALSLLSLSIAAANAAPIQLPRPVDPSVGNGPASNAGVQATPVGTNTGASVSSSVKHHRRLGSTGKARRRLSDARDAATRPSTAASIHATAAALSLATLSLGSSPPPSYPISTSHASSNASPISITSRVPSNSATNISKSAPSDEPPSHARSAGLVTSLSILTNGSGGKSGKRRGMTFTCESCSKVYRHPSCLIKHRWEHSPHWREASKFVLSKHQQVQLLEAAAILSHMSPSGPGTSLPEDRSLWPAFLSGGLLPAPSDSTPLSRSVPATSMLAAKSQGPRMHDYAVPEAASGITQLRPGLLATPTPTTPPIAVPVRTKGESESWDGASCRSMGGDISTGGWSIPRSAFRSMSGSSGQSRSKSTSEVDEDEFVDVGGGDGKRWDYEEEGVRDEFDVSVRERDQDEEMSKSRDMEEEWDGMEMEMEMD